MLNQNMALENCILQIFLKKKKFENFDILSVLNIHVKRTNLG